MTNPLTPAQEEELVAAIVRAIPELERKYRYVGLDTDGKKVHRESKFIHRPITLEDVLRALEQTDHWRKCTFQRDRKRIYHEIITQWHLGKPLSAQSPECKAFLHSLLVDVKD